MSAFEEVATGIDGMRGWKRRVAFGVAVSVVCTTLPELGPTDWETLVALKGDWYVFEGDFRAELGGLTETQLREWCEAKVSQEGRQEEAS